MIQQAIKSVVEGRDLSILEMAGAFREIMEGKATPAQIGGFLIGLRMKGETVDEIAAAASVMREKATHIRTRHPVLVDTCGTGGDGAGTFNISTLAALVASGAGVRVAKHGNRSASSPCGSADVLKALGVNVEAPPEVVEACLDEVGIAFLFAPLLHGAMKHAGPVRRELGVRTLFNILGPLTNPAGARRQLLGVYDPKLVSPVARVLAKLGSEHAFVVHGGGLDEVTLAGETTVAEVRHGKVRALRLTPKAFGLKACRREALKGGDVGTNVEIFREVLAGKKGPRRDVVVANAALALVAGEAAKDLKEGVRLAARSIDEGRAREQLDRMVRRTNARPEPAGEGVPASPA